MAVTIPPGSDPAQLLRDHGPAMLARTLATQRQPLADLVTDSEIARWTRWSAYPEGQIGALRATASSSPPCRPSTSPGNSAA